MYYELTINGFSDFGIDEPKDLPLELSLISGSIIKDPVRAPFTFTTNAKRGDKLPDFWNRSYPAFSKKFIDILEGAGVNNLQKFPAVVQSTADGTIWHNYFLVNIVGLIACADFEKSVFNQIFPGNYSFKKLVIDPVKPNGALLFRLMESPGTIIIHKSVGRHIGKMDPGRELTGWSAKSVV